MQCKEELAPTGEKHSLESVELLSGRKCPEFDDNRLC